MKYFLPILFVQLLGLLALAVPRAQAEADRYEDLAAWATRDIADATQFQTELEQARSAPKLAAAFQAAAVRQRKTTDDLIALVHVHPELRDLPTLGLDDQGLREWLQSHPHGQTRINRAPATARKINLSMQRAIAPVIKNQPALAASIRKYMNDPQVIAAFRRLGSTIQDNRHRLLQTFS